MKVKLFAIVLGLVFPLFALPACAETQVGGHSLYYVYGQPSTCEEDGVISHWECSDCGKSFVDSSGTEEITEVVLPKKGHDLSVYRILRNSCDLPGIKQSVCKRCGEVFREEVPGGEHFFCSYILMSPTKRLQGEGIKICTICGRSESYTIPALGGED